MRVLVCGGREYRNQHRMAQVLDELHNEEAIELVIQGGATGADQLAYWWALERGVPSLTHPANWKQFGPSAGPIRNALMLDWEPDVVVAFSGGKGTANMVAVAKHAKVRVMDVAA